MCGFPTERQAADNLSTINIAVSNAVLSYKLYLNCGGNKSHCGHITLTRGGTKWVMSVAACGLRSRGQVLSGWRRFGFENLSKLSSADIKMK